MVKLILEIFLSTLIYFAHDVTTNSLVDFPAVTICNINPFHERFARRYIMRKSEQAKCFYLNDFQNCMNTTDTNQAFDLFVDQLKRIVANDSTLDEEYRESFGYYLSDMLISCNFNGAACSPNDFITFWSYEYGNCYTFNQGNETFKPLKAGMTGNKYGLKVELVTSIIFYNFH